MRLWLLEIDPWEMGCPIRVMQGFKTCFAWIKVLRGKRAFKPFLILA